MASSTVEDYVKAIFLAQEACARGGGMERGRAGGGRVLVRGGRAAPGAVALGELAARMRVVPGTATAMVKALAEAGLVRYEPRRGVRLTSGGTRLALRILRRHRLVELFLVKVLELDWAEVHEEAEALEHAVSEKVVERLDRLLGYPDTDPHGDPIPRGGGRMASQRVRRLDTVPAGESVRVVRVENEEGEFLRFAERNGLVPGAVLSVRPTEAESGAVKVVVKERGGGRGVSLGAGAAGQIWVGV
jgi:DtxR family transcriptional regulator, Mn-dependent transcriptional regulator